MRETTNGSIVIISHQERILEIADEIVVISDGSILKHGTRDEILPEILGTKEKPDTIKSLINRMRTKYL